VLANRVFGVVWQVRAKHGDEITAEAVADMDYAEAVTKEALRYRIIVPFVFRKAVKAFQLGPYTIPKVRTWTLFVLLLFVPALLPSSSRTPSLFCCFLALPPFPG
jgi:hypothetical protein